MNLVERLREGIVVEKYSNHSSLCKSPPQIQEEAADRLCSLENKLEAAEKLIEQLYGTLEEAMTYCEGPQWSPSMVDDCKSALAAAKAWKEGV